ncbi:hypothetical protein CL655_04075 [bacterium]|nr:hypothetical protein [bacterium]
MITKQLAGVCGLLLALPLLSHAVSFVAQPNVFTPDVLSEPTANQTLYGELADWPHTFTFYVASTTEVRYTTAIAPDGDPVSLLLVRETERGVSEVARQKGQNVAWVERRDRRLGVSLAQATSVTAILTPGAYKLEISNAENRGRYQLQIGEGSGGGFWRNIRDSFSVHAFYGSWTDAFFTWRVLLLLIGIVLLGGWWHRRTKTKHA